MLYIQLIQALFTVSSSRSRGPRWSSGRRRDSFRAALLIGWQSTGTISQMRRHAMRAALLAAAVGALDRTDDDRWKQLTHEVLIHVRGIGQELTDLFAGVCQPGPEWKAEHKPSLTRYHINVPSCDAMRSLRIENYYASLAMLLPEAWRAKILDGLLKPMTDKPAALRPLAELLTISEPSDGLVAGGIFISQLLYDDVPSSAALMIGIHRMPRHKMLSRGQAPRQPEVNVTPGLVARAQEWVGLHGLRTLYVCPLDSDGHALRRRMLALGFRDMQRLASTRHEGQAPNRLEPGGLDTERLRFGVLALHGEVCEEAGLLAYEPKRDAARNANGAVVHDEV